MVLSDKTLFLTGVPAVLTETDAFERLESDEIKARIKEYGAALKGEKGGVLWAVSAADGKKIPEYKLPVAPIFDGMIAANGKLYIATLNGEVLTFEGK